MLDQLRTILHKTLHSGTAMGSDPEVVRRTYMLNGFLLLSVIACALMTTLEYTISSDTFYTMIWGTAAAYCVLFLVLRLTGKMRLVSNIALLLTIVISLIQVWYTRDQDTATLWLFALLPAIFFTFGLRSALTTLGALFFIISVWHPLMDASIHEKMPEPSQLLHIAMAFVVLTLFSALGEYSRARAQKQLTKLTEEMEQYACTDPLTGLDLPPKN